MEWRDSLTLEKFAQKWLPVASGTKPTDLMTVEVAYPFEWNCYESWNIVYKVRFHFPDIETRRAHGLGTNLDFLDGWESPYEENFCRIDYKLEQYFKEQMGRDYEIGDETYLEMRRIIQS